MKPVKAIAPIKTDGTLDAFDLYDIYSTRAQRLLAKGKAVEVVVMTKEAYDELNDSISFLKEHMHND